MQKFSDPLLAECPDCSGPVVKLMSLSGFALKGTGWYATDYKKKPAVKVASPEKSEGKGESKQEGKDAGKQENKAAEKSAATSSQAPASAPPRGHQTSGKPNSGEG